MTAGEKQFARNCKAFYKEEIYRIKIRIADLEEHRRSLDGLYDCKERMKILNKEIADLRLKWEELNLLIKDVNTLLDPPKIQGDLLKIR